MLASGCVRDAARGCGAVEKRVGRRGVRSRRSCGRNGVDQGVAVGGRAGREFEAKEGRAGKAKHVNCCP